MNWNTLNGRLLLLLLNLFYIYDVRAQQEVVKGEFGAAGKSGRPAPKRSSRVESKTYPFHGTLASVDPRGASISLQGKEKLRVILLTPNTRVTRNQTNAPISQAKAGERVTGSVRKNAAGAEEASTVRIAAATEARR